MAALPGERLPVLGNLPAVRQLQLDMDLMKTLPPSLLFCFPAFMTCHPVPADAASPFVCAHVVLGLSECKSLDKGMIFIPYLTLDEGEGEVKKI